MDKIRGVSYTKHKYRWDIFGKRYERHKPEVKKRRERRRFDNGAM